MSIFIKQMCFCGMKLSTVGQQYHTNMCTLISEDSTRVNWKWMIWQLGPVFSELKTKCILAINETLTTTTRSSHKVGASETTEAVNKSKFLLYSSGVSLIAPIEGTLEAVVLSKPIFLSGSHSNLGLAIPPPERGEMHFSSWVCLQAKTFTFKCN